jgi:hypothetical protein
MLVAPGIIRGTAQAAVDARIESGMAVDPTRVAYVARLEGTDIMEE